MTNIQEELIHNLINCSARGTIELVKSLLANPDLPADAKEIALTIACFKGHLPLAQCLLMEYKANIHAKGDAPLWQACQGGYLNIVQYLLTSPELTEHSNINAANGFPLISACKGGHLDIVQYLLTSPDLTEHANISAVNGQGLIYICRNGHLKLLKYLLTSPELTKKGIGFADIHAKGDDAFVNAHDAQQREIVDYLMFQYNIPLTPHITKYLNINRDDYIDKQCILKTFKTRDLHEVLQGKLPIKHIAQGKSKI